MTLINKNWLKSEILRAYLSGDPQGVIASQLNISIGTVNGFVSEIIKSDDTIELQRQIAIISKKNGVNIKQIATNLRFKNLVKQSSLDDKKIEKFLDAMDNWGNKFSISPTALAKQLFSIIEMTLRENMEPDKLGELIKSKTSQLREIHNQVEISNNLLEETKVSVEEEQKRLKIKQKDLDQFRQISNLLEIYEYPEFSTEYGNVARAMIDIKELGYDPKIIVSKYDEFNSLTKASEKLKKDMGELEVVLRSYRRKSDEEKVKWKDHGIAFEIFTRLVRDGLKNEDIFTVTHILNNDFSPSKIKKLIEDIRTYGSIRAAKSKLKRGYEEDDEFSFESP